MPDVITHLIHYSITIQVVALPSGFRKKSVREWDGKRMLFALNYLKQSYIPSRARVLQYNKSLPETTVMPY